MEVIAADLLALRGRIFCARGEYRRARRVHHAGDRALRERARRAAPARVPGHARVVRAARRPRARAREALIPMVARADAGEDDYQRMRVHYWFGEARLAEGETREAESTCRSRCACCASAATCISLRVQVREEPAPLLHALSRGIEVDVSSTALVEAGGAVELPLLRGAEKAQANVGEAIVAVLGEVGGRLSKPGSRASRARAARSRPRSAPRCATSRCGSSAARSARARPARRRSGSRCSARPGS
jgi:hypothetical protein